MPEIQIKMNVSELNNELKELFKDVDQPNRSKLTIETDDYFSDILQKKADVYCWLRSNGICVKKFNSNKKKSPKFKGKFHCIEKSCKIKFHVIIQDKNDEYYKIKWDDYECEHKKLKKAVRLRGETREMVSHKLKARGISNVIDEKIIQAELGILFK